jgi:hypothetical protein
MDTQDERARVLIVDRATGQAVGECHGAGAFGQCPNAPDGVTLPCAGCKVVPVQGSGMEGWVLTVSDDAADACPLAFLPLRDGR